MTTNGISGGLGFKLALCVRLAGFEDNWQCLSNFSNKGSGNILITLFKVIKNSLSFVWLKAFK
jgi:hypothetical protein